MIRILDDFLPQWYANELENNILSSNFPWYYINDISLPTNGENGEDANPKTGYGMTHWYFDNEGGENSPYYSMVNMIPKFALERFNMDPVHNVFQARSFLSLPRPRTERNDGIHIDTEVPHVVLLYYVNDCEEAPTYLFEDMEGNKVIQKIEPKKNRLAIFQGNIPHASSQPENGIRAIINFDLIHLEAEDFFK